VACPVITPQLSSHRAMQSEPDQNIVKKKSHLLLFCLSCPTFPDEVGPSFCMLGDSEVGLLLCSILFFPSG